MMESDSDEIYREIGIGCDFPDDGVGDGSDEIFHENEISHDPLPCPAWRWSTWPSLPLRPLGSALMADSDKKHCAIVKL